MGAAFYVVMNSEDPGFDTTVDGKALSRHCNEIDIIAGRLGFKALAAYCSQSPEEARATLADILGVEDESQLPPEAEAQIKNMPPEQWYDADHGLDYARQVGEYIRANPHTVKNAEAVLYDLDTMAEVMAQANSRGLQWHMLVDF